MPRSNILLRRLPAPKRVQLPNSRVFFAKYQRVNRHAIASMQVRIARTYVWKIGLRWRRRQQAGAGLDLSTAIDLGRKAAGSKLGKVMINDAIHYLPTACKKIKNKITNKKVKTVMDTVVDNYFINRGVELIGERFN